MPECWARPNEKKLYSKTGSTTEKRDPIKMNYTPLKAIKKSLIGILTTLTVNSAAAQAIQPTENPLANTHASCGCMSVVLAAGYTLEDNKKDKDDKDNKKNKDDKYEKKDKDDKDDKKDNDEKADRDSSPSAELQLSSLSGLIIFEVEKNGEDYDVYVDPKNCQIRAAIKDK